MNRQLYEYSYVMRKETQRKILTGLFYCILIFSITNLVLRFLAFPVRQVSDSMNPDFTENSMVIVTPLDKTPSRGDVMLLKPRSQSGAGFWKKTGDLFVRFFTAQQISIINRDYTSSPQLRRVVGMPGDSIFMKNFVLYIKPAGENHFLSEFELSKKPYNVTFYTPPSGWDNSIGVKGNFDEIVLGEDEYFVLGDNRKGTSDSRLWGTVSKSSFQGRILLCYFPFTCFKLY